MAMVNAKLKDECAAESKQTKFEMTMQGQERGGGAHLNERSWSFLTLQTRTAGFVELSVASL